MLQTVLIDILGHLHFYSALTLSKNSNWVIKFLTFIYITLIDINILLLDLFVELFFSPLLEYRYMVINDYGHSIGRNSYDTFIEVSRFYIIHL